ncbi:unnamed protein product, partial [Staurois parvus]
WKRYQGHLLGPPTDPGPSSSARVSKWSHIAMAQRAVHKCDLSCACKCTIQTHTFLR